MNPDTEGATDARMPPAAIRGAVLVAAGLVVLLGGVAAALMAGAGRTTAHIVFAVAAIAGVVGPLSFVIALLLLARAASERER